MIFFEENLRKFFEKKKQINRFQVIFVEENNNSIVVFISSIAIDIRGDLFILLFNIM